MSSAFKRQLYSRGLESWAETVRVGDSCDSGSPAVFAAACRVCNIK